MVLRKYALLAAATAALCLCSAPASAQYNANDNRPELISSTTCTTSAVVVGTIMLTVVSVRKDPTALRNYLRGNEPAVRAALATGGGGALADIAAFFGVDERELGRFGRVVRRHRRELQRLAFADDDAAGFVRRIVVALAETDS